jgi:transposase
METTTYTSKTLGHLGLISGLMKEIGLSELIDSCYAEQSPDQIVSNGKALEAMIINGLGFVNQRLYLVPQFFEDKPIARLLGEGFEASHFNDDRLGRALDAFYEVGVTPLFAKVSRRTFEVLSRKPKQGHLDTTTLSIYGRYNSTEDDPVELHITQGYSKDHLKYSPILGQLNKLKKV